MTDIERRAREWAHMEDEETGCVADTILAIHHGYRMEQEDVPQDILEWAQENKEEWE